MPRRPQRRPHLRGHAGQVLEAALTTGLNPFAQITRVITRPSFTKTVKTDEDIPASWKRKAETPTMSPVTKRFKESLSISPGSAKMAQQGEGKGSGNNGALKETPVDDPFNIQRGPPDYSFATLPFVEDRIVSANFFMRQHTFRMTSPYDTIVSTGSADLNPGSGSALASVAASDAADPSATKARWFELYASMYKYYHVIACRWHITIENQSTQPMWVHEYYGNGVERPSDASNVDMMLWRDTKSHYVGPVATAISSSGYSERNEIPAGENMETDGVAGTAVNYETSNHVVARGPSCILQLSGEYRPGDADREIRTDELVENWTLVNTNPKLPERLNIRIRNQQEGLPAVAGDALNYQTLLTYRIFSRIEYLVEFRELQDGLKYPVAKQPATFTIVTDTRS